jgi:hypothetical protein
LVKGEIKEEMKDFLEFNENVDPSYTNLWNTMKAVLRRKFTALSALVKKLERYYTSNLSAHLRALEQKVANSPKRSRRQEIVKLRTKINQIETKKTIQKKKKKGRKKERKRKKSTNPKASSFFESTREIKPLGKLTKGPRGSIQINKIRNKKARHNNKNGGNSKYHQILLQKPILKKTVKSRLNGSFSRQIPHTKEFISNSPHHQR